MTYGIFFCLLTSLFWAGASLFAVPGVRHVGSRYYNRLRLILVSTFLVAMCFLLGEFSIVTGQNLWRVLVSAWIGLWVGDACLFAAFKILSARRANLIFTLNIPFTVLLAWGFLGEKLEMLQVLGGSLSLAGILVAIASQSGNRADRVNRDNLEGDLKKGIALAVVAAIFQAVGLVILKPVFVEAISPLNIAAWRFSAAAAIGGFPFLASRRFRKELLRIPRAIWLSIIAAVLFGGTFGFYFYTIGIANTPISLASLLTSLSSMFLLPILAVLHRQWPPIGAWVGALICTVGIFLTLSV